MIISSRILGSVIYKMEKIDRKIPLRLKTKVYEAIVRPALMYGSECGAMKMINKKKMAT